LVAGASAAGAARGPKADHEEHEGAKDALARVGKRPGSRLSPDLHAEMDFFDGWGTVAGQLAALVER